MTIHRALGHVERSSMTEGAPLRVVLATEGCMADGIDLRMSGARLDRFRANPVIGYGHSYAGREDLPIGRINPETLVVDGAMMMGEPEFDQGDPFAREIERKMRDGYLNAVSIGFSVKRWEDPRSSYYTGGVAVEWELSELSVVPIGMDPRALVTSGRSLPDADLPDLLIAIAQRLGMTGFTKGEPGPEPPADPPPTIPDPINPEAARNLLAAFSFPKEPTR